MMKLQLKKKLRSRSGETITETLVALLISALALVMLAGAISAASGMVAKSRETLNRYYDANEGVKNGVEGAVDSVVKMTTATGGTEKTTDITIAIPGNSTGEDVPVKYFENDAFTKTPVIAYKKR